MKLGPRLILPLLVAVVTVMTVFAYWSLQQRHATVMAESRREARAYATALTIALESAFRGSDLGEVRAVVAQIGDEPSIFAARVYGTDGALLEQAGHPERMPPEPRAEVLRVLTTGERIERGVEVGEEPVQSVIGPLRGGPQRAIIGALEVLQPTGVLAAETRIRQRFLLNTVALIAALFILIRWLVGRLIARPLDGMVSAAAALGGGDLSYRVPTGSARGELAVLAREFNRMAEQLQTARAEVVREAEERVSLERRVREAEKLAAIGNLAAGLAHEIAAPLHVIQGRAELLRKRPDASSDVQERHLGIIASEIRRITVIVRNLLDFARRREPRLEPVELRGVVEEVAQLLEPEFERAGARLDTSGAQSGTALADAEMLHRVFLNLMLNALHAVQDMDGARLVSVATGTESPNAGGGVVVVVRDSGPGVPAELRDRIFEPLFSTKRFGVGTGFGLAVARTIVEEHGGTLELVTSDEGDAAGAAFRIRLPAAQPVHA